MPLKVIGDTEDRKTEEGCLPKGKQTVVPHSTPTPFPHLLGVEKSLEPTFRRRIFAPKGAVFCPKMYAIILYNLLSQELLLFAANGLVIPTFFVLNLSELS